MSVVLGLDPSLTCTGVALVDTVTGEVHTRRVIAANQGASLIARRNRIRKALDGILAPVPPRLAVTVVEVPHSRQQFGAQNERVALYWMLVDQLIARGPVVEVAPAQRAKLATGNGRASKDDVVAAMTARHPGVRIPDDNVADALALADAGVAWATGDQTLFNPGQAETFGRLAWPDRT